MPLHHKPSIRNQFGFYPVCSSIQAVMYLTNRKIVPIVLAIIYFCTASFVQIGHNYFLSGGASSVHQIQSHDCGKNERHKPLGSEKHCPLCQRVLQFVSILCAAHPVQALQVRPLVFPSSLLQHSTGAYLCFFDRGPPVLI